MLAVLGKVAAGKIDPSRTTALAEEDREEVSLNDERIAKTLHFKKARSSLNW